MQITDDISLNALAIIIISYTLLATCSINYASSYGCPFKLTMFIIDVRILNNNIIIT